MATPLFSARRKPKRIVTREEPELQGEDAEEGMYIHHQCIAKKSCLTQCCDVIAPSDPG
jgi:hypothetical protein